MSRGGITSVLRESAVPLEVSKVHISFRDQMAVIRESHRNLPPSTSSESDVPEYLPFGLIRDRRRIIYRVLEKIGESPRILEIGVDKGGVFLFIRELLASLKGHYKGVDIIPIDIEGGDFVVSDSVDFWDSLSVEAYYDLIFVDGNHSEAYACLDVRNALLHLSLRGVLLVHDIKGGGPRTAWVKLCVSNENLSCYESPSHPEGMGIAVKKSEGCCWFKEVLEEKT